MEQTVAGGLPATNEPAPNLADNSNLISNPIAPAVESVPTQSVSAPVTPIEQPKEAVPQQPQKTETTKPSLSLLSEEKAFLLTPELKQKLAAGDEKAAKWFEKFKSVDDMAKSYRELESKFGKTRGAPELPKDATPEQLKEYREQVGIPESWEKYDTQLEGINIGEADKPMVDAFLKSAHAKNLTSKEVKNSLQTYFEMQTERQKEMAQRLETEITQVKTDLQKEWGTAYDANFNIIKSHLNKELGEDIVNKLDTAELADGSKLIADPKILNYFLNVAKANGQSHTLLPNNGDAISLADRAKDIERLQRENPQAYYNNPKLSEEYNQIHHALRQLKNS